MSNNHLKAPGRKSSGTNKSPVSQSLNASINRKRKLQSLLQEGTALHERAENNDALESLTSLNALIEKTNVIVGENASDMASATNASEYVMDAAVMKIGHDIMGVVANKLGNNEFSENVYAEKVLSKFKKGEKMDWAAYGRAVLPMVKTPRFGVSMLGTFDFQSDPVVKEKKERVIRQRAAIAELKRPEKVNTLQKEEKGAQLIEVIRAQVEKEYARRGYNPLPYYEVILDREDFMHSIDNAFQVAFLVRDGHIGVAVDENNQPILYIPTVQQKQLKEKEKKTKQSVVGLTYAKWIQIKELFKGNEPILKIDRPEN